MNPSLSELNDIEGSHEEKNEKDSGASCSAMVGTKKRRITGERLKTYAEKETKKPALITKTSVILDVKPLDEETDRGVEGENYGN